MNQMNHRYLKAIDGAADWGEMLRRRDQGSHTARCLLELRDQLAQHSRLQRQRETEINELKERIRALEGHPIPEPAPPAGSLVDVVADAIHPNIHGDRNLYLHEARAAIHAVADWLEQFEFVGAVHALRGEVERHG